MGHNSSRKADRQNMKVIVKGLFQEVFSKELMEKVSEEVAKVVLAHTNGRLDLIEQYTKETLSKMGEEHRSVLAGLVRASSPLFVSNNKE